MEDKLKEVVKPHNVKILTVTSRDICKMLGKNRHAHAAILREIRECIEELDEMGFNRIDFFMDSTYPTTHSGMQPQFLCKSRKDLIKMQNETLATEVIKETQQKLNTIVTELNNMDAVFAKAIFALREIEELLIVKQPETKEDICRLQEAREKIDMLTGIAIDYVDGLRVRVSGIVAREQGAGKNGKL